MDEETVKNMALAKVRLEKHSSELEVEEIDRKTAAQILGKSVALLRKWEDAGKVHPKRKGRIVVYDEAALEEARQQVKAANVKRKSSDP